MASGLLVAGAGASLALAEPETGQGGSTSSPHEGGSTGPKEPTTGAPASGAVTPGGTATGSSGDAGGESKPTSQVGDGRNGLLTGHPTGTPVPGGATDPASKQTQHASGAPSQSGEAISSEQTPGGTSPVAGEPRGTAVVDMPPVVEPPVEGPEPGTEPPTDRKSAGNPDDPNAPKDAHHPRDHPRGWHLPRDPNDPNHPDDPKDPKDPRGWHHPHDPNDPDHPDPGEGQHPGWPGSWWKGCPPPGLPPGSGGGGGGHGGANPEPPTWHPPKPPGMQLPIPREVVPDLEDISVPFFDAVAGLATAASNLPFVPITLPVIVVPGGGAGGVGGPGAASRPGMPSGPNPPVSRGGSTEPPQSGKQQPPPAFGAGNQAMPPPSYRMGYGEYLRAAGLGEIAAVAIPGFTGILMLTGAGGLIGYRQARAGRSVRSSGTARFVS